MELQTIRQVSQRYGISRQMLCYYEQIGLIESARKYDYAYRVYDEDAIKRLQQIIILRKLQIPVKQIKDILNNQDAVAVIEIFKQNISELDEQITALSTVKSILARFVDEMQEKADIQLKLDLLNDKTMLAVVSALSFSENKLKEKASIDELNRASEQLDKSVEKSVKIVYRPPATVAQISYGDSDTPSEQEKNRDAAEAMAKKFIKDTGLFKIKPDMRVWGFGVRPGNWTISISIPDDLDVPTPLTKTTYPGGLYTTSTNPDVDAGQFVPGSNEYDWDRIERIICLEYFNPFNIYGLNDIGSEVFKPMYTQLMYPIRKIEKQTKEQRDKINTTIAALDESVLHSKSVNIDFTSMVSFNNHHGDFDIQYENGFMIIHTDVKNDCRGMTTQEKFSYPIKIDLRAKTDNGYITLGYAGMDNAQKLISMNITLRWLSMGCDALMRWDGAFDEMNEYKEYGGIPKNEFVDIEWIIGREATTVKVNGELRYYNDGYGYIKAFREDPNFDMSRAVFIGTEGGSTVTVESLRVTEI